MIALAAGAEVDPPGEKGPAMSRQRRLIHFSGTVQGVGFRYTTLRLARGFNVTGYVRNLPDGRVEMLVEGPADQIKDLLAAVADRMGHYIRETTQQTSEPTGQFTDFDISF